MIRHICWIFLLQHDLAPLIAAIEPLVPPENPASDTTDTGGLLGIRF